MTVINYYYRVVRLIVQRPRMCQITYWIIHHC